MEIEKVIQALRIMPVSVTSIEGPVFIDNISLNEIYCYNPASPIVYSLNGFSYIPLPSE